MNELIEYINQMVSYIDGNDYDDFLKKMDQTNQKYTCFAICYNEMNDNKLSEVLDKIVSEKLKLIGLEYTTWKNSHGRVVKYKGLVFCNIDLYLKRILINNKDLKSLKSEIMYLDNKLNEITELLSKKFKKITIDEIKDSIEQIKQKCEYIDLPIDEWEDLVKKVSNAFKELGFQILYKEQ